MQIQLKQSEIISAIKQYVGAQGINLSGKTVDISFTAGRKEGGLTADVVIEESVPQALDFSAANDALKPIQEAAKNDSPIDGAVGQLATDATDKAAKEPAPEAGLATGTESAAPAKTTTSLFG